MRWVEYVISRGVIIKNNVDLEELFKEEAQIRAKASPYGICGTQSFTGTCFCLDSGSFHLYDYTTAPHPHFNPSTIYVIQPQ